MKNALTEDGITRMDKIQPTIKTMMKTKLDVTATNLDLILNRDRTPPIPTAGFIKALKKGQYTYKATKPGGLFPLAIPYTNEDKNIQQLLAAEMMGEELNEGEKISLTSNKLFLHRTVTYETKMMATFASTLKVGGKNSIAFLVAQDITNWMLDNEQKLSENTFRFDRHLSTKIIYTIGAAFNNYSQ